ncbi:VTT domain-containing protein [Candidatus Woesebacteria bacterium]|nr:VTT domain-containing protein [Candidatus Woesebacteria bacterium]
MPYLNNLLSFLENLDQFLIYITDIHRYLTYVLLFIVIFVETGLVITPFLPGDSLLFAAGALVAISPLKLERLMPLLFFAAVLGDSVNYFLGNRLGIKVFDEYPKLFKKKNLVKTQKFYKKHGGKTVIISRFIPIIRTFSPFVAGVGSMKYSKFLTFSIIGGVSWTCTFILAGHFFGNIPLIKNNFSLAIITIVIISLLPVVIEAVKTKNK